MKIDEPLWETIKKNIELTTDNDPNVTDVTINIRIKQHPTVRNYYQLNANQYTPI
tara:strand:- start:1007 stop:1171 length:165 start_codon:yes stop_codon:yes gene_type:complete